MKILEFLCGFKHFGAVRSSPEARHQLFNKVLASSGFCFNSFSGPVFPFGIFPKHLKMETK